METMNCPCCKSENIQKHDPKGSKMALAWPDKYKCQDCRCIFGVKGERRSIIMMGNK